MAISNKYKDTLDDLIDSSDIEFSDWPNSPNRPDSPDWPGLFNKGSRNAPRSRGNSLTLLEEDYLDEDVLVTSLDLVPKI